MKTYTEFCQGDFDAVLHSLRLEVVDLPRVYEVVYQRVSADGKYAVRVYSSVSKDTGTTRSCGSDAIRVVMVDLESGRPMKIMGEGKSSKSGKRVNRTTHAMTALRSRVVEYLMRGIPDNRCPKCESVMATRKGSVGEFLGCTKYPQCNGTRNI